MKFKTTKALSDWYGISAPGGAEIDVPDHLLVKAENMPFLEKVKKTRKKKSDDKDIA